MMLINYFFTYFLIFGPMVLFDFNKKSSLSDWMIVDDVVMGGRSDGHFEINKEGHGVFYGLVSLENNGGFSSVRYKTGQTKIDDYTQIKLRIKGDGKGYQFRVKSNANDRHSYIYPFESTGDWQEVIIPLAEMEPRFRGRILDMPNYPGNTLEELAILISNKKAESFQLEIDQITLE